nr:uncharacterized protein LOC123775009 [Procambarus clarkii]
MNFVSVFTTLWVVTRASVTDGVIQSESHVVVSPSLVAPLDPSDPLSPRVMTERQINGDKASGSVPKAQHRPSYGGGRPIQKVSGAGSSPGTFFYQSSTNSYSPYNYVTEDVKHLLKLHRLKRKITGKDEDLPYELSLETTRTVLGKMPKKCKQEQITTDKMQTFQKNGTCRPLKYPSFRKPEANETRQIIQPNRYDQTSPAAFPTKKKHFETWKRIRAKRAKRLGYGQSIDDKKPTSKRKRIGTCQSWKYPSFRKPEANETMQIIQPNRYDQTSPAAFPTKKKHFETWKRIRAKRAKRLGYGQSIDDKKPTSKRKRIGTCRPWKYPSFRKPEANETMQIIQPNRYNQSLSVAFPTKKSSFETWKRIRAEPSRKWGYGQSIKNKMQTLKRNGTCWPWRYLTFSKPNCNHKQENPNISKLKRKNAIRHRKPGYKDNMSLNKDTVQNEQTITEKGMKSQLLEEYPESYPWNLQIGDKSNEQADSRKKRSIRQKSWKKWNLRSGDKSNGKANSFKTKPNTRQESWKKWNIWNGDKSNSREHSFETKPNTRQESWKKWNMWNGDKSNSQANSFETKPNTRQESWKKWNLRSGDKSNGQTDSNEGLPNTRQESWKKWNIRSGDKSNGQTDSNEGLPNTRQESWKKWNLHSGDKSNGQTDSNEELPNTRQESWKKWNLRSGDKSNGQTDSPEGLPNTRQESWKKWNLQSGDK